MCVGGGALAGHIISVQRNLAGGIGVGILAGDLFPSGIWRGTWGGGTCSMF